MFDANDVSKGSLTARGGLLGRDTPDSGSQTLFCAYMEIHGARPKRTGLLHKGLSSFRSAAVPRLQIADRVTR